MADTDSGLYGKSLGLQPLYSSKRCLLPPQAEHKSPLESEFRTLNNALLNLAYSQFTQA
jgi:hypothetical protein